MSKKTVVVSRIICMLALCLIITATVPSLAADYGVNLFQSGDAACESLNGFNENTYNTIQREIVSDLKHSGSGSVKVRISLDGENGYPYGTYQTYVGFKPTEALVEGEKYIFSVWYYNPDNISGRLILRFTSVTGDSISNWITGTAHDSAIKMSNGGWHKYEYTFTATNKLATDLKYFYLTTDAGQGKNLYFDDASLVIRDPADDYKALVEDEVAACESDYALTSFNSNNINHESENREISKDYAHSGDGSLKITIQGNYKTFVGIKPKSSLVQGGEYYFSVWYYNPDNITGRLFIRFTDSTNNMANWVTGTTYDSGASLMRGGWNKYEFTFTASEKVANNLKYFYLTSDANSGVLYFDDINLRLIPDEVAALENVSPQSGNNKVKLSEEIRLDFTAEVDKTDVDAVYYVNDEEQDKSTFVCSTDGKSLVITPKGGILPDTKYKIVINRINDACGRTALENQTIEFTTTDRVGFKVNISDENDKEITNVKKGTIKADFDLTNNTGDSLSCTAVVMVCEGERVKKVYFTPVISLEKDAELTATQPLNIDIPNENCYLKAFLWSDSTDNLRALAKDIEIK